MCQVMGNTDVIQGIILAMLFPEWIRELVSKETVVLRRWGVEKNVWLINRVDNKR